MSGEDGGTTGPPAPVRIAAVGVLLEGLAALVAAVALAATGALTFSVWGFLALVGIGVGAAGVALLRGTRGARGPAVVAQLLLLGVAYYAAVPSGRPFPGVLVALLAVGILTGLLCRAGREWAGS